MARISTAFAQCGRRLRGDLRDAVAPTDTGRGAEYDYARGWEGGGGVEDAGVGEGVYV